MDSLALRVRNEGVEPRDEASPTGFVRVERGASRAVLLTPDEIEPDRSYPLITVLHGAGRQDEMLVEAYRDEAERRQALLLVPRSVAPTWDLIAGGERVDADFLEYAFDLVYRRYPVDSVRQALVGYSDGASYALSLALSNPGLFDAAMVWAAGFVVIDPERWDPEGPRPRIYQEHGTHDELFPFDRIAVPLRDNLRRAGCKVTFSIDEGGRHWPSGRFAAESLDWYLLPDAPPTPSS